MNHTAAIAFITTNWPNAFPTPQAASDWDKALADLPRAQVLAAVQRYHAEDARDFKPAPGAVRKMIGTPLKAPFREATPEDHDARRAWDKEQSIKAAKSLAGAIDMLERQNKLEGYRTSLIDACETIAKEGTESDYWLAARCLSRLDALEIGPDVERSKHWRARLNIELAPMGEPIRDDLDFGNHERWSEENT